MSERTPIKIDALKAYLQGYDRVKTQYLLDGFSQGFMLQSQGLQSANTDVKNPSIPNQLVAEVQKKALCTHTYMYTCPAPFGADGLINKINLFNSTGVTESYIANYFANLGTVPLLDHWSYSETLI